MGDGAAMTTLLSRLTSLRAAAPAPGPSLDAALVAEVHEAAPRLNAEVIGQLWGRSLHTLGRETHTYALVARLLGDPVTRDIGAQLARAACQLWRAAAVELVPLLVRSRGQQTGPAFADAFRTASISGEAMRVHGALPRGVPFEPYPKPRRPRTSTSVVPAHDHASAAGLLAAKPIGVTRLDRAPENDSTPDGEMALDERLLAAALSARGTMSPRPAADPA